MVSKIHRLLLLGTLLPAAGYADITDQSPPAPLSSVATTTPNSIQLGYALDHYSRTFEDNPILTLQYGRITNWGSLLLRANDSSRYQTHDTQYEIDLYPRLWEGSYAYLNLGVSEGNLFPNHRHGAEIYTTFPNGLEGSLGFRRLEFTNSGVTLYTGSISKYLGDYLFTFRPYITPSHAGSSISGSVSATRYFADADEYIKARVSIGKSAEEQSFAPPPPPTITLRNSSFGLSGQWSPRKAIFVSPAYGHERQELIFAPGEYVGVDKFSISVSHRF